MSQEGPHHLRTLHQDVVTKQSTGSGPVDSFYVCVCVRLSSECSPLCWKWIQTITPFSSKSAAPLCSSSVILLTHMLSLSLSLSHTRTNTVSKPRTFPQGRFRYSNHIGSVTGLPNFPHKPQRFQMLQGGKESAPPLGPRPSPSPSSGWPSTWHGSHLNTVSFCMGARPRVTMLLEIYIAVRFHLYPDNKKSTALR